MMKKSSWSLKDKKQSTYDLFIDGTHKIYSKDDYHYDAKDIEMLREKLIKDILCCSELMYPEETDMVIKCINKRFGVE